jgi:hypothetical protein
MTDFTSKQTIYYEAEAYNASLVPIPANVDESLIYPLLQVGTDFTVGVNKATIPLSEIPLTKSNIPLKFYEVALQQGSNTGRAYVRQLNGTTNNFLFSVVGATIQQYVYNPSTGQNTLQSTVDLSNDLVYIKDFICDDFLNYYVIGSNVSTLLADTFYIFDDLGNLLSTIAYNNLKSIYIDISQNIYIADETLAGAEIDIYSNQNGAAEVELTFIATISTDFAGDNLFNIAFVVATNNNVIIGHSLNILTYYTIPNYTPLADVQNPDIINLAAGNVLNYDDTLICADVGTLDDVILGVKQTDGFIYNIPTNTLLANGIVTNGNPAIVTQGYLFAANTAANRTSYVAYPITNPPQALIIANTSLACRTLMSNEGTLQALSTNSFLYNWNLDVAPDAAATNTWGLTCSSLQAAGSNLLGLDYLLSTDQILAVNASNNLYKSEFAVYPFNFYSTDGNGNVYQVGLHNFAEKRSFYDATAMQTFTSLGTKATYFTNSGGFVYSCDTGNSNFYQLSAENFSVLQTFSGSSQISPGDTFQQIKALDTNFIMMVSNLTQNIYIYNKLTGIFRSSILTTTIAGAGGVASVNCICSFEDGANIAIIYNPASQPANVNLCIFNYATNTVKLNVVTGIPFNSSANDCVVNNLDVTNNIGTLFVAVANSSLTDGSLYKIKFQANFTALASQDTIYAFTQVPLNVSFHPGAQAIFIFMANTLKLYKFYQTDNYLIPREITLPLSSLQQYSNGIVFTDLQNTIPFTQITSNKALIQVAVSKKNMSQVYGLGTDNLLYLGNYTGGSSIVFTQLVQYPGLYTGISTTIDLQVLNTTLTTFNNKSQTVISTVSIGNNLVSSIAKNEITGHYIVPLRVSNSASIYNSSLVKISSLGGLTNPLTIFSKNGEDIFAGDVDIFSFSVLIDYINLAFQEAFLKLKQNNPTPPPNAPSISLNYQTGLCTLTYDAAYTVANCGINFNAPLYQLIAFLPKVSSTVFSGLYELPLIPTEGSITQTSKTIYQFNQLSKILIQSLTIAIKDSYFGNNQQNFIITTIDAITDQSLENIGQVINFQPSFIRPFTVATSTSINRIQISVYYKYKNLSTYQMNLSPGNGFNVNLAFIKKF